jgi:2-dehydropantoate 2-reductase
MAWASDFPPVAVLGAGAVGCYFGGMLARAGRQVTFIGRAEHVDAMARDGLLMDSVHFQGRIQVSATKHVEAARGAGVLLFCVKTLDTERAIRMVAPHLGSDAIVVSLQNGVDNAERIRAAVGIDAVPAAVYVAAQMSGPGAVKHNGRGDLVLPASESGRRVATLFDGTDVPCRLSPEIAVELWTKLIMNVVYNALSALTGMRYGKLVSEPLATAVMKQSIDETITVAGALGIRLPLEDVTEAAMRLGVAMAGAMSSTAQDIARGKLTEIDSLNGYVVRKAAELGIPAPVNQTLHALVKLLEQQRADLTAAPA